MPLEEAEVEEAEVGGEGQVLLQKLDGLLS